MDAYTNFRWNCGELRLYTARLIKSCDPNTKINHIELCDSKSAVMDANTVYIKVNAKLLKVDKLSVQDTLKILAAHEVAHVMFDELNDKKCIAWRNPTKANHLKSLIKICIETACDIWAWSMCKKVMPTDRMYNTVNYIQELPYLINTEDLYSNIKRGIVDGNMRASLMVSPGKLDKISDIVIIYWKYIEFGGIQINPDEYTQLLYNELKENYPLTLSILTGTYKYPRLAR